MNFILSILIFFNFSLAKIYSEETRQVDKHEHGLGKLTIQTGGAVFELEVMMIGGSQV